MSQFTPFQKIPRLNRDIIITEKIDGTNAAIVVERELDEDKGSAQPGILLSEPHPLAGLVVRAQSRSRFIGPENDNAGFARWVFKNADQLATLLGEGIHFGEWWGKGVNIGYGVDGKRFSLFNVSRWNDMDAIVDGVPVRPVPKLYEGPWFTGLHHMIGGGGPGLWAPAEALKVLQEHGSIAAPRWMKPEGIVVFHTASGNLYKATIEKDDKPKGSAEKVYDA